jgi:hypothetical protein
MKLEKREEESSLSAALLERKTQIQTELLKLLEEEELYWHKRSNLNWLLKGDSNTEFFHRYANGKKRKNPIYNMEKGDTAIQGEEILAHATDYCKNLFGPSEKPLFNLDSDCWTQEERVTEEENEHLTKPFSMEELKKAVNSMERNMAPGPDHIPVEFYQSGWEIIKTDLFDLLNEFWDQKLEIGRLNYGVITLIPKIKEASRIQHTGGRIPGPTGDLSQGIRVRGRWRRWATTALVRRGRWEGGGAVLQYPRGYCSREQGGGGGRIRVGP